MVLEKSPSQFRQKWQGAKSGIAAFQIMTRISGQNLMNGNLSAGSASPSGWELETVDDDAAVTAAMVGMGRRENGLSGRLLRGE